MTERTAGSLGGSLGGLPSPEQVTEILGAEFARAGYEIENVTVDFRIKPPRITVVADGDSPLDLDAVAELSRVASTLLDDVDTAGEYVLEVTSPGVDRPLTTEKHFRRARGRKVELELADGSTVAGRIGALKDGTLDVVIRGRGGLKVQSILLTDVRKAVVQVEFSAPSSAELELAGEMENDA